MALRFGSRRDGNLIHVARQVVQTETLLDVHQRGVVLKLLLVGRILLECAESDRCVVHLNGLRLESLLEYSKCILG